MAKAFFPNAEKAQLVTYAAEYLMHNAGDKFNSADHAAIAFGIRYGYATSKDNVNGIKSWSGQEYGAVIVGWKGGTYSFEHVVSSSDMELKDGKVQNNTTPINEPWIYKFGKDATVVGTIHSHPSDQHHFSGADGDLKFIGQIFDVYGVNLAYLVTKNGMVKKATYEFLMDEKDNYKKPWEIYGNPVNWTR